MLIADGNEVWNLKKRPRKFDAENISLSNCRGRFLRFHTSFQFAINFTEIVLTTSVTWTTKYL